MAPHDIWTNIGRFLGILPMKDSLYYYYWTQVLSKGGGFDCSFGSCGTMEPCDHRQSIFGSNSNSTRSLAPAPHVCLPHGNRTARTIWYCGVAYVPRASTPWRFPSFGGNTPTVGGSKEAFLKSLQDCKSSTNYGYYQLVLMVTTQLEIPESQLNLHQLPRGQPHAGSVSDATHHPKLECRTLPVKCNTEARRQWNPHTPITLRQNHNGIPPTNYLVAKSP
jgi:hypothetical protein